MFDTPLRSFLTFLSGTILVFSLAFALEANKQVMYSWQDLPDDQSATQVLERLGRLEVFTTYEDETTTTSMENEVEADAQELVIWLHVGGFRTDYLNKAAPQFLSAGERGGYSTKRYMPVFPTLTWPNLVSQATGKPILDHGIVGNSMRDPGSGEILEQPTKLAMLKAEPIWTTAKRQGIRVLVHDWPFSQEQPAENAADLFLPEFDHDATDEDRLNALFDAWDQDAGEEKIRLIMGCLFDLEKAAQKHGTREQGTLDAVKTLDSHLKAFFDKVQTMLDEPRNREDKIHVLITTGHGMADVKTKINLPGLMGELDKGIDYALNDGIAHIWFRDEVPNQEALAKRIDDELGNKIYATLYKPEEYPEEWGLTTDTPDRVVTLKPEYYFTDEPGSEAVYDAAETDGPFASAGYSVIDTSRMRGQMLYFQFPDYGDAGEMNEIGPMNLHATVCDLLGIEPAEGVTAESVLKEAALEE